MDVLSLLRTSKQLDYERFATTTANTEQNQVDALRKGLGLPWTDYKEFRAKDIGFRVYRI